MLSGLLLGAVTLIAIKGRTEGLRSPEQRLGKHLLIAALLVMAIGVATGL